MNRQRASWTVAKRLVLVAIAGIILSSPTAASGEFVAIDDGARVEELGVSPNGDGVLVLVRVTLEPGAELRAHRHPGAAIMTVESGILETRLIRGDANIYRGAGDAVEPVDTGAVATLQSGDVLALEEYSDKTMANRGDDMLVLTVTLLGPSSENLFVFLPVTPGSKSFAY